MGDAAEGPESRVPLVALRDAFAAYVQVNHIIQLKYFILKHHSTSCMNIIHNRLELC